MSRLFRGQLQHALFIVLLVPGLLTQSRAALSAAAFRHAYIWVHWYCTEAPDIEVLFPKRSEAHDADQG